MTTLSKTPKSNRSVPIAILFLVLLALGAAAFFLFFEGESPTVALESPGQYVGASSIVEFSASDAKSGLRSLSLSIIQGDTVAELYQETFPRQGYTGSIGPADKHIKVSFVPKKSGFDNGPATLRISASDFSMRGFFRGNARTIEKEISIDTVPPKINIIHTERYINPGGSGIAIYRVDDPGAISGVQIEDRFHPGFLVGDGRDDTYIAFFGLPFDAEHIDNASIVATDPASNKTVLPFSAIFKDSRFRQDRINVGDGFLQKKIPEFEQHYPVMQDQGALVNKYLYTNNQVRHLNNSTISELCNAPHPERLWSGRFLRMSGSTRAGFADHRTYYYGSKPIDKQVHLGIDIASTRQAEVKAAEKGIVIYADYLGIYGNMVMLDHGQGLFSLYSHLSQIDVSVGDTIEQGVVLGLTGTTGMAGGDHLHFSVLVNGIFVTPKEWWDQHWIDVTIEEPLTESRFH